MKNTYYLLTISRTIWKQQFRHFFMLAFVGIFLASFSSEVLGQTTVISQNFDGITMGTLPSAVYTIDNGNSGCSGSADLWRISSSNPNCACTCNTNCGGNRAVIDYGASGCSQDATLVVGSFSGYASVDVSFGYAANIDGSSDQLIVVLYDETTMTSIPVTTIDDVDINDASFPATTINGLNSSNTYSLRFTYIGAYEWGVQIDNVLIVSNCNPPSATTTIVPDCGNGEFSVDVNVTLNDATALDITNDADISKNVTNVGAGITTIGPFTAGTDVIITLEGTAYSGCDAVLTSITEACACSTPPVATVTSNAPDCGNGNFDIDVNITNLGGGATANTSADIYVNGVLESSNVALGTTTINKPIGTYTIYIEGIGGTGFATCVTADESATASCNNDECAEAFAVLTDGTPTTSLDVTTYTSSGNNLSCDGGTSNEDAYYAFVAPASGSVIITVDNSNLSGTTTSDVEGAIYASCADAASNTEVDCFSFSNPLNETQIVSSLTVGATYYLEVEHYNNNWTGTYDVIITDPTPPISAFTAECWDLSTASHLFDLGDSGDDYDCGFSSSYSGSSDDQIGYIYTPATNEIVDIIIDNVATTASNDFAIAIFDHTAATPVTCVAGTTTSTDATLSGINLTGGISYLIIIGGYDSTHDAQGCITVRPQCGVTFTNNLVNDCGATTFTRTINFSNLGGATNVVLDDADGNVYGTPTSGITISTDYAFSYTDLATRVLTINGYDGAGTLICSEEVNLTAGCVSNICVESIDILGNEIPADMAAAVNDGSETDFGGEPNFQSCGNGTTIGNCSAGTWNNAYYETNYNDLWFVVNIPDGGNTFDVNITDFLGAGHLYILPYASSGDCSSLSLMDISNSGVAGGTCPTLSGNGTITFSGADIVTASTNPIYLRVIPHENSTSSSAADACDTQITYPSFTIEAIAPQANDICGDAIDIDGTSSTGDLCQASTETENSETGASCGETADANDLWYSVTMDAADNDQLLEVDLTFTNADDAVVVELYHNCFTNTFLECATVSSTGAGSTVNHAFSEIITAGGSGPDWFVRVIPVTGNSVCDFTIQGNRVAENNNCDIANQTFPTAFTITNPVLADFQFATPSNVDGQTDSDLWYVFDPEANTDAYGHNVYSTEADVLVSGLAAGEEITIMLYKRRSASSDLSCINYADDYLSTLVIDGDGTSTLSCLDEVYGTSATSNGYIIRILQTAGGTDSAPTITVTPSTDIPPFNNSCENIWDGDGPAILGSAGIDAAHGFNAYYILNGETQTGNFSGATDCDSTIPSGMCNGVDYEAITETDDRDMWYVFTVPDNECATLGLTQSTVLYSMDITYDANDAFHDGIIYIYSDCSADSLKDCSGALDGAGTTWTANGLEQGKSYLMRVKPWDISSTPTDWSFDVTVNDGDVAPCNDKIENAEGLAVNINCSNSPWYPDLETFSALGARDEETFGQDDVFFSFVAPLPANGGAYNPQTNPDGSFEKSWVNIFLENVSGHVIQMELWNTQQIVATATQYSTSSTAGDKIWARFGNLIPGETYQIRLYHGETITTDVQYKIRIEASENVTSTTECNAGDIKAIPVLCGSCGGENSTPYITDPAVSSLNSNSSNNHCEVWYKIDLPVMAGGSGTYWVAEVRGVEQVLDFELRQQIAAESLVHGVQEDFDHPCSSRPLSMGSLESSEAVTYEVDPGPVYNNDATTPTPYLNAMGTESQCQCVTGCSPEEATSRGGGFRKVYSDILGPAAGTKNYLYLRVFMDEDDPSYTACHDGGVLINPCQVIFKGPYSSNPTVDAGGNPVIPGEPDLECSPTISFVSETSTVAEGGAIEVCVELQGANGNAASADIVFDAVDAGTATNVTDYTIANPALPFTATFPASASSGDTLCFTINAINDNPLADPDEIINFDLENPVGSTLGTITEHITTITEGATGSISGNVFLDQLANGLDDGTDTDIEGITVTLTNTGTAATTTVTTLADGSYIFTGLADGNYTVSFGMNDGTTTYDAFSAQDVGGDDLVDSEANASGVTNTIIIAGNNVTDIDAGMYENVSITGTLFNNNDGTNGTMPVADGTMEDIIVTYCVDAVCSTTTDVTHTVTIAGGSGGFSITDALPGTITAINSTNYAFEETTVVNAQTDLVSGGTIADQNFALYSISGNVFLDNYADGTTANSNGDGTGTDAAIQGITVTLTNTGDASTMTATTLADGSYIFTGLADGASYTVSFGMNDGTTTYDAFSAQDVGGDDLVDSEANASGVTNTITIAGSNVTDVDAGMYENITISGALFSDNDGTVGTTAVANGTMETIIVTYCVDAVCSSTTDVSYPITTTGNTFNITNVAPGIISAVNSTNYTFEEASVVNTNTPVPSGGSVVEQDFAQELNVPNAVDDTATTPLNTPVNIINLINDTFGNDGPSSTDITIITNGMNGTGVVNDGGTPNNPTDDTIDYTPNNNFVGTDTITYQICDSTGDCDTAVITITISSSCNANTGNF